MVSLSEPGDWSVSRETREALERYETLVRQWNPHINLVSDATLEHFGSRHIDDSIQLLRAVDSAESWLDFGSGGGLPGLPVAIVAREWMPDLRVILVESDKRKAAFLLEAVRTLKLDTRVINNRIENLNSLGAHVISARAVADLRRLLELSQPHLAPNGRCVFPKGKDVDREVREAKERWQFNCRRIPSVTDAEASIIVIDGLKRA